ncbi:MAG: hypothetical protein SGJ20_01105, partial [Planctomycetota bacterium]|nr:hypothetical protein [Planctomycetota bacterium]
MLAKLNRSICFAVVCLSSWTVAQGQQVAQVPRTAVEPERQTFGDRLGSMFGGGNRNTEPTRRIATSNRPATQRQAAVGPQAGVQEQPSSIFGGPPVPGNSNQQFSRSAPNPTAGHKMGVTRPSQTVAPATVSSRRNANSGVAPVMPMGPTTQNQDMRNVSPDDIQSEPLPMLTRRVPAVKNTAPSFELEEPEIASPTATPTLQDKLTAVRKPQMADLPTAATDASAMTTPPASEMGTNDSMPETEVINLANRPAPVSVVRSAPRGTATAPKPADQPVSSRRGYAPEPTVEQIATSNTERTKAITTPGTAAVDTDVLITRQSPLLSVETAGPRTIVVGKEATYNVVITNSGEVAAQDVTVTIRIPEWAEVVSAKPTMGTSQLGHSTSVDSSAGGIQPTSGGTSAQLAAQPFQWNLPRLEARGKEQLALRLIPRKSRPFDLGVQWTFMPISSQAHVEVQEPKLAMTLNGPDEVLYGQTETYKMTLSNPGTGDAENVAIHLSPIGDPNAPVTKHQIGMIAAGDSKVIEVELTAKQAGKVVIKATALADNGLQADVIEEVLVRRAGLNVEVEGTPAGYTGTTATYQIQVSNPGNATAESVQVFATLPAGAKYVSCSGGGQPSSDGSKVTWTVPMLRAGADSQLELKCVVNTPGTNRLQLESKAAGDISAVADASTKVEALADLKLEVVDPKGPTAVGEEITYEIKVRNRGTKTATGVNVAGYFSEGVDPISASGGAHDVRKDEGGVIFTPIAALAPGAESIMKIKARAFKDGNHIFLAKVICESVGAELISQETTMFYGDSKKGEARTSVAPVTKPVDPAPLV